jgi:hypothetical protein
MTEEEKYSDKVQKDRDYSSDLFDKQLVYLSAGALVLTIGFVKDLVVITDETNTILLIISWISFTLSLIAMLLSHRSSVYSMDYELDGKSKKSDDWDLITKFLNWVSTLSLIIGIILFIIFISKNI